MSKQRTGQPQSTFAYAYGINRTPADDWFDPKLHADTPLFVDPFLVFNETEKPWSTLEDRMVAFFNEALGLVADAGGDRNSKPWLQAATMFSFPEPPQFCLGLAEKSIFGSGSGPGLGRGMMESAHRAIRAGITSVGTFGDIMIFGEHFGADRISDMTCNIVMDLFVAYTQTIARRHSVPTEAFVLDHFGFDLARHRWKRIKVELPRNPYWASAVPVLLTPAAFLNDLPKMEDGTFWDWVYSNFNDQLRSDLNIGLNDKLDKRALIERARRSPNLVRRYGERYEQTNREHPPMPYDLATDPKLVAKPIQGAQTLANFITATAPASPGEFCSFTKTLAAEFKWIVEGRGLWRNFWTGDTPVPEPLVQNLFHTAILLKCKDLGIDVSPESDAGRGPVDFKLSADWGKRSLVEIKFAKSSSYWDNLEQQTLAYLKAEGCSCGVFLVIQHFDRHCTAEFVDKTKAIVAKVSADSNIDYDVVFVDVRPKVSASKLKNDRT